MVTPGILPGPQPAAYATPPIPVPFTEEALPRGINCPIVNGLTSFGRGLAAVDLDNDDDPDLVALGRTGGFVAFFENDDGYFHDRTATSNVTACAQPSGISAADADDDGDLDLYVTCWAAPNLLLRNDGDFQFTEIAAIAGVDDEGAGAGTAWSDVDLDGDLDLYLANYTSSASALPNRLYLNQGGMMFDEAAAAFGVDDPGLTWQPLFFDFDGDGDDDLYISNDKGATCLNPNRLWENVGGTFKEITPWGGAGVCIDSMGVAAGDFNGDTIPDLYCTNSPWGNPLLINRGRGQFLDASTAAGVASYATGWGTLFLDFNNDSHLDLFVCNHPGANRLFAHDGQWPAFDLAPFAHIDDIASATFAATAADIDDDGDLDLFTSTVGGRIKLFVNHEGQRRHWIKFRLRGMRPNRFAIGTTLHLRTGTVRQSRQLLAGEGYKSQCDHVIHFGVGAEAMAVDVEALFPGGRQRIMRGLRPDTTWTLHDPALLFDADSDTALSLDDYSNLIDCMKAAFLALVPGCEIMDGDGDGRITLADIGLFQNAFGTSDMLAMASIDP